MGLTLRRHTLGVAALAFAFIGSQAAAQSETGPGWSVVSVNLLADLTAGDGAAEVSVRFVLSGTPRGAALPFDRPLAVSLLGFGGATATRFAVDGGSPVDLQAAGGSRRTATVTPPDMRDATVTDGDDVVAMTLRYRIDRAVTETDGSLLARIPVLSGPSAPTAGDGVGFRGRVITPPGWRLSEPFPSGLGAGSDGGYEVSLAVAPAFVGFRGRSDGSWRPGLPLLADLLTLAVLLGVLVIGSRHLRGLAA